MRRIEGRQDRVPGSRRRSVETAKSVRPPIIVEAPSSPAPAKPTQSWLLRLRDAAGSTRQRRWHHDQAIVDGEAAGTTQLAAVLEAIAKDTPGEAARLAHSFDHEIQEARKIYLRTISEEDERLARQNQAVADNNKIVHQKITDSHRNYSNIRDVVAKRLAGVGDEVVVRQMAAADILAQGGTGFSPDRLTDDAVLMCSAPSVAEAGEALNLPPGEIGVATLHPVLWHGLSATVGSVLGIGLAVGSHLIYSDQLARHWEVTLGAAACGIGIAIAAKAAVSRAAALAGALHFSGHVREARIAAWVLGGVVAGMMAIDASVLKVGLLTGLDADAISASMLSHTAVQPPDTGLAYTLVGLSVSAGYLLAAAYEGFTSGMRAAIGQATEAFSAERLAAMEAARRSDPAVRRGLAALGKVRLLEAHKAEVRAALGELDARHQEATERLETSRLTPQDRPDSYGTLRIHEAREEFLGPLIDFRHDLRVALAAAEPGRGWGWVIRIFGRTIVIRSRKRRG